MTVLDEQAATAPALPLPRGEMSSFVIDSLIAPNRQPLIIPTPVEDPIADDDLQLALYCLYELHYRGFAGVRPELEWDPVLLAFRATLERAFEHALRDSLPPLPPGDPRSQVEELIATFDGPSVSEFLHDHGTLDQLREFVIHRSAYQLKEADPHTWGIPRFNGPSRAALVQIQADEYGEGEPGEAHADLFSTTMQALDLVPVYGAYIDWLPGITLATCNLVSMFGLHRRLLPALLGHLAVFEMCSVEPMSRYAETCTRLGLPAEARRFYDVHVQADVEHARLAAESLVGRASESLSEGLGAIAFGAAALLHVEDRFARHLLDSWNNHRVSLLFAEEFVA